MAAVTGHLEQGSEPTRGPRFSGFAGNLRRGPPDLAASHASLTRTHWVRNAAEQYLAECTFQHEWDGRSLVIMLVDAPERRAGRDGVLRAAFPQDAVPFSRGGSDVSKVEVWGLGNKKMDCPVFDLPAGATAVGGTCPGANGGQSVVPNAGQQAARLAMVAPPTYDLPEGAATLLSTEVKPASTICQSCYAEGGSFAYSDNAARLIVRYWWALAMVNQHYDEFVQVLFESALKLKFPSCAPGGILPIRLHASGDFFSIPYAEAWMEVADRLALDGGDVGERIRFWAPTRTWATPAGREEGWQSFWEERLPRMKTNNFMVRASGYHFDDPAPGALAPGNALGSTSLYVQNPDEERMREDFRAQGEERLFFDWQCPTYSQTDDNDPRPLASCSVSPNPFGGTHCRACWVAPNLRINYPAH